MRNLYGTLRCVIDKSGKGDYKLRVGKTFLLLLGWVIFSCNTAIANEQDSTGNTWHQLCNTKNGSRPEACYVYAMGIVSGANAQAAISNSKPVFCAPPTVNYAQLADIFYKYLDDHPENRHINAVVLAMKSWQLAFPCSK